MWLLGLGTIVLINIAAEVLKSEVKRREKKAARKLLGSAHAKRQLLIDGEIRRREETRAFLWRARRASSNPRWQASLDALCQRFDDR